MNNLLKKLKYLLPLIGAFLGALGGQGTKQWRRVVLPIFLSICGVLNVGWWGITSGVFGAFASMGYGIPDDDYPINPNADSGSTIGRFWTMLFRKFYSIPTAHKIGDIFTRGTVGLGMCFAGLSFPIIKGNWGIYGIGCLLIMIGQTVFSYRAWGEIPIGNKKLLVSDLINYGLIFTGYLLMLL